MLQTRRACLQPRTRMMFKMVAIQYIAEYGGGGHGDRGSSVVYSAVRLVSSPGQEGHGQGRMSAEKS